MQNFWNRLASKYGTKKYWQERGEEASIVNAVSELHIPDDGLLRALMAVLIIASTKPFTSMACNFLRVLEI